jgi:hypothetical protein
MPIRRFYSFLRPRILYVMYSVVTNLDNSHTSGSFIFLLFLVTGKTLNLVFLRGNDVAVELLIVEQLQRVWKII